ncbi:MAG: MmcB family DNA repair protein [Candidatus Woesearchaeota archaeon]|jgi:hypothetical protein|nr:MmcB family DNA repair protein [Candidatus Woesearchaeota archaeon]
MKKIVNKITTPEMEIILMSYLDIRRNIIIPNLSWGMIHYEADIVSLTKSNYATEIEIKISMADLKKDKEKRHNHDSIYFKYLYFAVPWYMKEKCMEYIPEKAGLLVIDEYHRVFQLKSPMVNKKAKKWTNEERIHLLELCAMRMYNLKKKVSRLKLLEKENKSLKKIIEQATYRMEQAEGKLMEMKI